MDTLIEDWTDSIIISLKREIESAQSMILMFENQLRDGLTNEPKMIKSMEKEIKMYKGKLDLSNDKLSGFTKILSLPSRRELSTECLTRDRMLFSYALSHRIDCPPELETLCAMFKKT